MLIYVYQRQQQPIVLEVTKVLQLIKFEFILGGIEKWLKKKFTQN